MEEHPNNKGVDSNLVSEYMIYFPSIFLRIIAIAKVDNIHPYVVIIFYY
jgi:hypothetical protein